MYICDVILMPFDEEYVKVIANSGSTNLREILDTTGYLSHGEAMPIAVGYDANVSQEDFAEVQGNGITLVPGVDNRLYFWGVNDVGSGLFKSDPLVTFTTRINIVPRWKAIRTI